MDAGRRLAGLVASFILVLSGCSTVDLTDLVRQGLRLREGGRFDESAARWIEAIRVDPGFCTAYINAAESYRRGGKSPEAIAVLENAGPCREHPEILLVSGLIKQEAQEYQGALREFETLARHEPDVPEHYVRLGDVSRAAGDLAAARQYYEIALTREQRNPKAELALARLMAGEGDREGAIGKAEAAVQAGLRPDVIGTDPELAVIRNEPRIVAMVEGQEVSARSGEGLSVQVALLRADNDALRKQLLVAEAEVQAARSRAEESEQGRSEAARRIVAIESSLDRVGDAAEAARKRAELIEAGMSEWDRRLLELAAVVERLRRERRDVDRIEGRPGPSGSPGPAGPRGPQGPAGPPGPPSTMTLLGVIMACVLVAFTTGYMLARRRWERSRE